MGTSRAGSARGGGPSPLASRESARARLRRLQKEIGRTPEKAKELEHLVSEFVRLYREDTFLLDDARFHRFQKALRAALDSLGDFTPGQLKVVRGRELDRPPAKEPTWSMPLPSPEPYKIVWSYAPPTIPMSLETARERLAKLHEFFVDRTPLNGPENRWSTAYFNWADAETRRTLRGHSPRPGMAVNVIGWVTHWNRSEDPAARFGAAPGPTELMLLAALCGLDGEGFDGSRETYIAKLDAWGKAIRRATNRTKPKRG